MQETRKNYNNKFNRNDNLSYWIKEYEENYNLETDLPQEAKSDLENIFQTSKLRNYFHTKYLPKLENKLDEINFNDALKYNNVFTKIPVKKLLQKELNKMNLLEKSENYGEIIEKEKQEIEENEINDN